MVDPLPSLNALRAFDAAARHLSFTKAAQELHVTQGAVSHHVKALEAAFGFPLFIRRHQALELTAAGRAYVPVVRDAFERLSVGTADFLRAERSGKLTVSMSPNFAAKWMVHRLGRFAERHPALDLRISPSIHRVDFAREDVDMAIRHGDGRWPDLHVTRLCVEAFFPVCSPRLLERGPPLRTPADLRHFTLLHDTGWRNWPEWLAAAGAADVDATRGPSFDYLANAIDAAVQGQGIALARTALAAQDLIQGRLVRPFAVSLPAPFAYFIVCPRASATKQKVVLFRDWLVEEAEADARALARMESAAA